MIQTAARTLPSSTRQDTLRGRKYPRRTAIRFVYMHMKPRANVYVGVRSLGEHLKLSLHGPHENPNLDRYCQFGMPRGRLDAMRKAGLPTPKEHYFCRWQRPVTPKKGAIQVVSIIIPTDLLNKNPPLDQSTRRRLPLFLRRRQVTRGSLPYFTPSNRLLC